MAPGWRVRAITSVSIIRLVQTTAGRICCSSMIEKAEIEAGIVRDERRIFDEFEQLLGASAKRGLSDRKIVDSPWTASASLGIGRSGLK